jgi:hypothetical protein
MIVLKLLIKIIDKNYKDSAVFPFGVISLMARWESFKEDLSSLDYDIAREVLEPARTIGLRDNFFQIDTPDQFVKILELIYEKKENKKY